MTNIPEVTDEIWIKVLRSNQNFDQLALQLLCNRLRRSLKSGAIDENGCAKEMHAFFIKYKNVYMNDLTNILKSI